MKFKPDSEKRFNMITGKISHLQKLFRKVDEGLSEGTCEKIEIFRDKVNIFVTDKPKPQVKEK